MSTRNWLYAIQRQTFRCTSQDLGQAVSLECAAVLLGVLRHAVLAVSRLLNRNRWCDGKGGGHWRASEEAGGSGERQGKGGGGPAWHMCDPFILQLLQIKLDDFFSL